MPEGETAMMGLFPLGLVLLPGEALPLHVFEERYKRLIGERRVDQGEFGVVLEDEGRIFECGCSAIITAVLEEFPDGRLNVLVEGRRRFRVLHVHEPPDPEGDYARADVQFFDDDEEGTQLAREGAVGAFYKLLRLMGIESPQVPAGTAPLSFRLAAAVDFGVEVKQALLDSASESERLANLAGVIKALVPRLEAQRKRAEAIRGNGKGMDLRGAG
jgi:Lon protease-like protein